MKIDAVRMSDDGKVLDGVRGRRRAAYWMAGVWDGKGRLLFEDGPFDTKQQALTAAREAKRQLREAALAQAPGRGYQPGREG